jgi:two-component system sensor histidine kinase RegB
MNMASDAGELHDLRRGYLRLKVNESWLLRLRWVAVVGQLLTVAAAALLLRADLPLAPLLVIILATAVSNAGFAIWLRRGRPLPTGPAPPPDRRILTGIMTMDLVALTALLYFSGGPTNPFTVFYLVNLALAAVILPARRALGLTLLAVVCLAGLYFWHVPLAALARGVILPGATEPGITLGQLGFVVAFSGSATVISYFITRVTRELQLREQELRIAEQQRARSERLEALATLAAGAAHELASPLSTIAVIAKDLTRHLEGTPVPVSVVEDVQLIRGELDHCREILNGLASSAGQATGEALRPMTIGTLVDDVLGGIRRRERVRLELAAAAADRQLVVPRVGMAQAIRGIVRNALDASPDAQCVELRVELPDERWCSFQVIDQGLGMAPEILARAGEPFFTTKRAGTGHARRDPFATGPLNSGGAGRAQPAAPQPLPRATICRILAPPVE